MKDKGRKVQMIPIFSCYSCLHANEDCSLCWLTGNRIDPMKEPCREYDNISHGIRNPKHLEHQRERELWRNVTYNDTALSTEERKQRRKERNKKVEVDRANKSMSGRIARSQEQRKTNLERSRKDSSEFRTTYKDNPEQ